MAEIRPFRGILYSRHSIKDLRAVVAPPYDVISSEGVERYFARHEKNIIRLIMVKGAHEAGSGEKSYRPAAEYFQSWLKEGTLLRDPQPAIYVYSQRYLLPDGCSKERFGYIARLKLEDFESGVVMPHEFTFSKPRLDRLNLIRTCRANFDQIFCVYPDPAMKIDNMLEDVAATEKETCSLADEEGIVNRLWTIVDPAILKFIVEQMADKNILLADGHHRYEAALTYRNEARRAGEKGGAAEYVMAYLVNMYAPGLSILPYHRVVKGLPDLNGVRLYQTLSERFLLKEFKPLADETTDRTLTRLLEQELVVEGRDAKVFAMFGRECGFWLLKGKEDESYQGDLPIADHLLGELDVSILHQHVIEPLSGADSPATADEGRMSYTSDPYRALNAVERGEGDVAFYLNPVTIDKIMAIGRAGGRMPQKSTCFYPKPITGMVMNKLDSQ